MNTVMEDKRDSKGRFGKGNAGKPKGASNTLTREIRGVLKEMMSGEIQNLPKYLNELEPKEKIEIIIKMLPFILPKVNTVHYTENEPKDFSDPLNW